MWPIWWCIFWRNVCIIIITVYKLFFRPLAYSTLADLVHHVRNNLSLRDLSLAVNLFSKNVHDDSLPSSIQTMSCKLLLNLVDCIRTKSDQENGNVCVVESEYIVNLTFKCLDVGFYVKLCLSFFVFCLHYCKWTDIKTRNMFL